ncbi:hypothetical protein L5M43_06205 [Shewanella sp. SW36]|uniref:hypothetical protein n=1 Tax=unclassified Shewanella TaxID=196818 RepID=UPI0021D9B286|nr:MULTISPECIES: hypothetical protein [unclassified Shewanella]MCU7974871.1 hypothetical protein [Shewanella sp. SW36]MCU7990260.1 hypothetical protein [Shewanella sp. SW1]MCU8052718.1 hypothetical protein [Shewanella sp. SM43]
MNLAPFIDGTSLIKLDSSVTWSVSDSSAACVFTPISVSEVDASATNLKDIMRIDIPMGKVGILKRASIGFNSTGGTVGGSYQTAAQLEIDGVIRSQYPARSTTASSLLLAGGDGDYNNIQESIISNNILVESYLVIRGYKATANRTSANVTLILVDK